MNEYVIIMDIFVAFMSNTQHFWSNIDGEKTRMIYVRNCIEFEL